MEENLTQPEEEIPETESALRPWLDADGMFDDFTIAEQLLWHKYDIGAFGDIPRVFGNMQKRDAIARLDEMLPEKLAGIRDRSWKLPKKAKTYEDEVLLLITQWLRRTDASYPSDKKLMLVDLAEATKASIRYSMEGFDDINWMHFIVYVIDRRANEDLTWEDWKKTAKVQDTIRAAEQIVLDYMAYSMLRNPPAKTEEEEGAEVAGTGGVSPLVEASGQLTNDTNSIASHGI